VLRLGHLDAGGRGHCSAAETAEGKRKSGSFAIARVTAGSKSFGTPSTTELGAGGGSLTWA
jgi:hypothetical protein